MDILPFGAAELFSIEAIKPLWFGKKDVAQPAIPEPVEEAAAAGPVEEAAAAGPVEEAAAAGPVEEAAVGGLKKSLEPYIAIPPQIFNIVQSNPRSVIEFSSEYLGDRQEILLLEDQKAYVERYYLSGRIVTILTDKECYPLSVIIENFISDGIFVTFTQEEKDNIQYILVTPLSQKVSTMIQQNLREPDIPKRRVRIQQTLRKLD